MANVSFRGQVRFWDPQKASGLAVVDIPADLVVKLGGRKQMRVSGRCNGEPFTGSTMLVAGGGFCVGISKAALAASGAKVGEEVAMTIGPAV